MKTIDKTMISALNDGVFPGASLHVSVNYQTIYNKSFGSTHINDGKKISNDTIFDLASLTKPLATSLVIMHLIQAGKLSLEQSLPEIFPEASQKEKFPITVQHLLCHNSGLPDHRPYYKTLNHEPPKNRSKILLKKILEEPLINSVGKKTVYSDLGFMLLAAIIKRISGYRLDNYINKFIYQPMTINDLFFIDLFKKNNFSNRVFAATENCPWRKKILMAEVHDDNAYSIGGICGHAGLFGTVKSVYYLLDDLLGIYHNHPSKKNVQQPLNRKWVQKLLTVPKNAERALGFDVPTPNKSSSGHYFSANSVGHLGFTGTSFWIDLERSIIVILLTNRVHPRRDNTKIRKFRPMIHDIVMQSII